MGSTKKKNLVFQELPIHTGKQGESKHKKTEDKSIEIMNDFSIQTEEGQKRIQRRRNGNI